MEKITYSQVQCYLDCPRKWECRYKRQIVKRDEDISALRIGSHVHEIIALYWRGADLDTTLSLLDRKYPDRDLFRESAQEWARLTAFARVFFATPLDSQPHKILSVECPIEAPILNPRYDSSSSTSRTFAFAGVCDAVFQSGESIYLGEHKTKTGKVDGGTIKRVSAFDLQIGLYAHFLGQVHGKNIEKCVYDVHEKPQIKLKIKQTPDEYIEELIAWYAAEPRSWVEEIPISPEDKLQAREVLWDICQKILWDSRRGRFSQNPGACEKWGRFCAYHELCCSKDSPLVQESLYEKKEKNTEVTAAIAAF